MKGPLLDDRPAHAARNLGESFGFAWAGLRVLAAERNFRIHLAIAVGVLIAGGIFHVTRGEWLVLLLTIALMLAVEGLNTALEATVDLVCGTVRHPMAQRAKDAAAAACLVVAGMAVVIGLIVFTPYLLAVTSQN